MYLLARWLLQNNMGELYELLHYGACVHTSGSAFFHLFLSHETHSAILCAVYEDHAIFTDKSKFEEAHSRGQGLNKSKLQLAHELLAMVCRYSRNAAVSTIVQAKHDAASE